ncbi:MAG: prolyl oligopeptidase family serine peptidase [Bacteroidaceae bacterium]|nr:prolyl oligopeptidase family serine peptidase [Bacteroidaceae bacterium]
MRKSFFLVVLTLLCFWQLQAQSIDTIEVRSASMDKDVETVIVIPDAYYYNPDEKFPVIYLLHGYSGNAKTWIGIKPNLLQLANERNVIFVCPDGKNSWYWDSPLDPKSRYETFVSKELIAYIDTNYRAIASPSGRAITGLSMGGHGGLWLSIRHSDVFGAGGSMSGGLDIRPFPDNWEMKKQLGEYAQNKERWDKYTVINALEKLHNNEIAIIIDCGFNDFFYEVNKNVHNKLLERGINHEFIVRPGAHNAKYWNNAIDTQVMFFRKFFDKTLPKD